MDDWLSCRKQMDDWLSCRKHMVATLREYAKQLLTIETRCQWTEFFGNAVEILGLIVTSSLFIAAFFTGGLTLPAAIVSGVCTGFGWAISLIAKLVNFFKRRTILKQVLELVRRSNVTLSTQSSSCLRYIELFLMDVLTGAEMIAKRIYETNKKKMTEFMEALKAGSLQGIMKSIIDLLEDIISIIIDVIILIKKAGSERQKQKADSERQNQKADSEIQKQLTSCLKYTRYGSNASEIAAMLIREFLEITTKAFSEASNAVLVLSKINGYAGLLFLPVDIICMIKDFIRLIKGVVSEAATGIQKLADAIETETQELLRENS